MKKLVIAATLLVAFSMLASTGAVAEPTHPNEVGLYTTPDGYGATGTTVIGAGVYVYLVLTKPTDVNNGGVPFSTVNAFEATLRFDPVPNNNLFLLYAGLPPFSVDIGPRKDINGGYLDYIVGIDLNNPVLVTDESVVLVTFQFLNVNVGVTNVYLEPTTATGIAGEMAFLSISGQLDIMHPISGSHDAPVFTFNGEAVVVENDSWGSVKSLYR